ncbi:cation-transporting P-type ATPase [Actinopolymorpha alba]|uniref:cation-transporting P-type ATPase n=1 Tax=Actinopolymorpha alba TaxID=533267 RepID=UPI000380AD14|nr:cation-transporting P-type ATPase [Actinopolymorpha alba]
MTTLPGREGDAGVSAPERDQGLGWHALEAAAVLERLDSGPTGLDEAERARRLASYGPNAPTERKPERWWAELAEWLTEPLQLLLIAVAVLSAVFREVSDAVAIAYLAGGITCRHISTLRGPSTRPASTCRCLGTLRCTCARIR